MSTNCNWYNRHFHVPQYFQFPSKVKVYSFFSLSFNFNLWSTGTEKSTILKVLFSLFFFFLLIIIRFGRLAKIWWSVCISKSQWTLCVSFSWTDSGLCIYHLFIWSNFNFLHNSPWITLSYLVLYYFCVNLLHSLIMWSIVSSLSPHNQHLLFCGVLSILALI